MGYGKWALVLITIGLVACDEGVTQPQTAVHYTIEVSGEQFQARVLDAGVIEDLDDRLASGHEGVILGSLIAGDGGFNAPWGWHWDPSTVEAADAVIELCDGRPSMVDEDLAYWIGTVGTFCPWGATVVARNPASQVSLRSAPPGISGSRPSTWETPARARESGGSDSRGARSERRESPRRGPAPPPDRSADRRRSGAPA